MIRYRDKIFEDYFIDKNTAIITDKFGNVQDTYLHHSRMVFKSMPVHCIMMHTYNDYKEGLVVHHVDFDKDNNALSNLKYMTRQDHNRLHSLGKTMKDETKDKLKKYCGDNCHMTRFSSNNTNKEEYR